MPGKTQLQREYEQRQGSSPLQAEYDQTRTRKRDALLPIAQGATLGFADEILGGIEGLSRKFSGGSFREGYAEGRDRVRQAGRDYAAAKPKTDLALTVAGGLATGGVGAVRAGVARTGAKVLRGAKVGAGYGAVAGAGTAEGGMGQRLTGAAIGGAGGALAGAAVPVAATAVRRATGAASRGVRQVPGASRVLPAPRGLDPDETKLAELLAADKKTPQMVRNQADFLGDEGMLVDVGGPNIRGAAKYAATKPGAARAQLQTALGSRLGNEDDAIRTAVRQKLGTKTADEATQELEARLSTEAKPLYDVALPQVVPVTARLLDLLSRPAAQTAMRAGRSMAVNEGVPGPEGALTVRTLDYAKRALDDRIGTLLRSGKKDKARVLRNLRREILEEVDAAVPEYKQARATYAGPARSREMIRMGEQFTKKEVPDLARQMARLSDSEREFYKLGVKQKVLGLLDKGGRNRSRALKLDEPAMQERMEAVLGPQEFAELEAEIARRLVFRRTSQNVLGGSDTFIRAMEAADMEGIPVEQMVRSMAEPKQAMITAAVNAIQRRRMGVAGKRAEAIARMLSMSPNDPRMLDLLARIEAAERRAASPRARVGRAAGGALSRGLAIGAGSNQ